MRSACQWRVNTRRAGFTLLELVVAISLVGLVLAVSTPAVQTMYQSMQYRESVRDVLGILAEARREALDSGRAQDVEITPAERRIRLNSLERQLPEQMSLAVTAASELGQQGKAVIRFYPEGGTTGGDLDITQGNGRGVRISVDWLMGGVVQVPHDDG